jgi:hypothetical protein
VHLSDVRIMIGQGHEVIVGHLHCCVTVEKGEFSDRTFNERWTEPSVDQLDEVMPGRRSAVKLKTMVLKLGIVQEV